MSKQKESKVREKRIIYEVVVDCYDEIERAMGWYYYLENALDFPFQAKCIADRSLSPLSIGDEVTVIGMPSEESCEHEMFVAIKYNGKKLAVPLMQLKSLKVDGRTKIAIEDWHYWVAREYRF